MPATELDKTTYKAIADLKAYYRFESGALTTDSSTNSRTLTAIGTPTETTGYFGGGVQLASASSQAYSIADSADMKPTGNFTVGAWIKTSTTATQQGIFQSWHGTNLGGILFDITTSNVVRIGVGSNTGAGGFTDVSGASNVCDGNWHFVVARYNGSIVQIFVDGKVENGTARASGASYNATNYVRIGCENNTGTNLSFFNGTLDDVFFYNGFALSTDAIKEIYEGRSVGEFQPQANLTALYHLNGSSQDFIGSNNGTDTAITYSFANGKFFQGAGFNGSTSRIELPNGNTFKPSVFTIAHWIRTTTNNANIFSSAQVNSGDYSGFKTNITSGGKSMFQIYPTNGTPTANDIEGARTITDGKWHFIVATYDGTNMRLYVDGTPDVAPKASNSPSYDTDTKPAIGASWTNGSFTGFYSGAIDEVALFSRALSAQEIARWYAWSLGRFAETL